MTVNDHHAVSDRQAMVEALAVVEEQLLAASADHRLFAKLQTKPRSIQAELDRLGYLARREEIEDAERHRAALIERIADARARYQELSAEAADVDAELIGILDRIDQLLPRCAHLARAIQACSSQEGNALSGLRRAGEPPEHPTIGAPPVPSRDLAVRAWLAVHELIGAAGLNSQSAVLTQTRKR